MPWHAQTQEDLSALNTALEEAVRNVGVPEEQVRDEAANISALFEPVRERLESGATSFNGARSLLSTMQDSHNKRDLRMAELRTLYAPEPPINAVGLTWRELIAEPVTIETEVQLDDWLYWLKTNIKSYLADCRRDSIR